MLNLDNQERAFIYQWMGSLLSKELTQEQLSYYQNGHFDSLFELLGEMGFSQQVDTLRNTLKSLQYDQLELCGPAAQGTGRRGCHKHGSRRRSRRIRPA